MRALPPPQDGDQHKTKWWNRWFKGNGREDSFAEFRGEGMRGGIQSVGGGCGRMRVLCTLRAWRTAQGGTRRLQAMAVES